LSNGTLRDSLMVLLSLFSGSKILWILLVPFQPIEVATYTTKGYSSGCIYIPFVIFLCWCVDLFMHIQINWMWSFNLRFSFEAKPIQPNQRELLVSLLWIFFYLIFICIFYHFKDTKKMQCSFSRCSSSTCWYVVVVGGSPKSRCCHLYWMPNPNLFLFWRIYLGNYYNNYFEKFFKFFSHLVVVLIDVVSLMKLDLLLFLREKRYT